MMQLAKPASSLPQAAVIAPSNAAGTSTSSTAATPFSALLESHQDGQQHGPAPTSHLRAPKESTGHDGTVPIERTQEPSRASTPERLVDKQAERNRLNAHREAKQAMSRTATPPRSNVAPPEPVRNTGPAAQSSSQEDAATVDEDTQTKRHGESDFNPLALLQWIGEQAVRPALEPNSTAVAQEAQQLASSDVPLEDTNSQQSGVVRVFSTIKTAADSSATSMAQPWVDKTPGVRAGLTGKLALTNGLLATSASQTPNIDTPQNPNSFGNDSLVMGDTSHIGAIGLEGWNRAVTGATAEISNAIQGPQPKVAATSTVAEPNNTPQPFTLGPANNALADTPSVSVNLPAPVQSPEFRELLGNQISLLAKDGVQSAELHLNPAEMGPVSVQITLDGTQARVDFGADSAQTRQFIEASLPELASALRDAGLTLSGGGVSQHANGRENQQDTSRSGARSPQGSDEDAVAAVSHRSSATARRVALGGVDLYA
jgi:flagellar hook-length control protein FliK